MTNSFTHIRDLASFEGQEVTLAGWVYNSRASGKIQFLIIRDGMADFADTPLALRSQVQVAVLEEKIGAMRFRRDGVINRF